MFNAKMFSVMKRELKARIMTKGFIIMTVLLPALMLLLMFLPSLLMKIKGEEKVTLLIVSESSELNPLLKAEFDSTDYVRNGEYILIYQTVDSLAFNGFYEKRKQDILSNKLTGMVFIPKETFTTKEVKYYSTNPNNSSLTSRVGAVLNRVLLDKYFSGKNVTREDLEYTRKRVDFDLFRVSKDKGLKKEGKGNLILAMVLLMLLYFSLLFMGSFMLRSVIEEKDNRIVEILLSSVSPTELMIGKIFGNALTGLLQMAIWLIPLLLIGLNAVIALPPDLIMDISLGKLGYFFIDFLLGLLTYLGLFAMVGSIFDNQQDAQSSQWPLMILIILPFYVAITLLEDPSSPLGKIVSMLPFGAIMVMPVRMTLINVPIWQLITALVVNVLNIFIVFYLAAKIYRIGILMTGKKPKWSEVVRWFGRKR